ncbi:unnamed protein product [Blepharisma stoltei]|uniref:Uncharacterized protein n=1 Tax=Blepharisma stoltei TaxID=1481888 RepID=A0AAU9KJ26_9CILI|nr:unnamed protein product [Blepharisma stoltei]
MFVSAISGSSIGTFLILKTVQKYKRVSFIVLLLAITMVISLIGIPLYGILNTVDQIENGSMKYGFNAFC